MCKKVTYSLANHYDLPGFVVTSQVGRMQEVCDAVRKTQTVGTVIGQPGVGKSWAARHTTMHEPEPEVGISSPVIYTSADVQGTARDFLANLLTCLGPDYRAPTVDMTRMVCSWVHRRMTELVIVDDADRLGKASWEIIYDIHNRTKVAFVCIGPPGLPQLIKRQNKLVSCVSLSMQMDTLTFDELGEFIKRWNRKRRIGDNNSSVARNYWTFGSERELEMRKEIYRVTLGNLRRVLQFIAQTERVAQVNGDYCIELPTVRAVALLFANQQQA